MQLYIPYFRVSTDKQGLSGLGMEAQREAVTSYARSRGTIVAEFTEVESGKKHTNRPQLIAALAECRRRRAMLVIAKLDRLARNVHFISGLMNSDVEFVAVDNPTASRLTIHILAAVAEHEREMISQRTKAALAAAKARGIKLGNPRAMEALILARAAIALPPPAPEILNRMLELRSQGFSLREIAAHLNGMQTRTPKGSQWYASTVSSALDRFHEKQTAREDGSSKGRKPEFVLSFSPHFSLLNEPQTPANPSVFVSQRWARTRKTEGESAMFDLAEAYKMLDTFVGSGAANFDVTFIDIDGEKRGYRAGQTARQLRTSLPQLIPGLQERQQNIIVRPHSEKVTFIQLDDLSGQKAKDIESVACLTLETSTGNYQAWMAVSDLAGVEAKDIARRLRKGVGADLTASGATRVAGTPNYKRKYEPDFPTVRIAHSAPGRSTTTEQLEKLGLLAAPEPAYVAAARPFRVSSASRHWPDYERCVQNAPRNNGNTAPDVSRADFFFCMMASQRGFRPEEIAAELMRVSKKAQENGERYCEVTANNAAAAAERGKRSRA